MLWSRIRMSRNLLVVSSRTLLGGGDPDCRAVCCVDASTAMHDAAVPLKQRWPARPESAPSSSGAPTISNFWGCKQRGGLCCELGKTILSKETGSKGNLLPVTVAKSQPNVKRLSNLYLPVTVWVWCASRKLNYFLSYSQVGLYNIETKVFPPNL